MLSGHHRLPAYVARWRISTNTLEPSDGYAVPVIHAVVASSAQGEIVVSADAVPAVARRIEAQIRHWRSRIQRGLKALCAPAPLAGRPHALARQPVDAVVRHNSSRCIATTLGAVWHRSEARGNRPN